MDRSIVPADQIFSMAREDKSRLGPAQPVVPNPYQPNVGINSTPPIRNPLDLFCKLSPAIKIINPRPGLGLKFGGDVDKRV